MGVKNDNLIEKRSYDFAVRIVNLYKHLKSAHKELILSKQILRSGTSIGANVCEATRAQSKNDFIAKISIALKESYETDYWLRLLNDTEFITEDEFKSIYLDCQDISNILAKILITSRGSQNSQDGTLKEDFTSYEALNL